MVALICFFCMFFCFSESVSVLLPLFGTSSSFEVFDTRQDLFVFVFVRGQLDVVFYEVAHREEVVVANS